MLSPDPQQPTQVPDGTLPDANNSELARAIMAKGEGLQDSAHNLWKDLINCACFHIELPEHKNDWSIGECPVSLVPFLNDASQVAFEAKQLDFAERLSLFARYIVERNEEIVDPKNLVETYLAHYFIAEELDSSDECCDALPKVLLGLDRLPYFEEKAEKQLYFTNLLVRAYSENGDSQAAIETLSNILRLLNYPAERNIRIASTLLQRAGLSLLDSAHNIESIREDVQIARGIIANTYSSKLNEALISNLGTVCSVFLREGYFSDAFSLSKYTVEYLISAIRPEALAIIPVLHKVLNMQSHAARFLGEDMETTEASIQHIMQRLEKLLLGFGVEYSVAQTEAQDSNLVDESSEIDRLIEDGQNYAALQQVEELLIRLKNEDLLNEALMRAVAFTRCKILIELSREQEALPVLRNLYALELERPCLMAQQRASILVYLAQVLVNKIELEQDPESHEELKLERLTCLTEAYALVQRSGRVSSQLVALENGINELYEEE